MAGTESVALDPTRSVALDIGGDAGAVVVYVDGVLAGHEVEARPVGHGGPACHAAVIRRDAGAVAVWAVVIDGLTRGGYSLWLDGAEPWGSVEVEGGAVAQVDCRGRTPNVAAEPA